MQVFKLVQGSEKAGVCVCVQGTLGKVVSNVIEGWSLSGAADSLFSSLINISIS